MMYFLRRHKLPDSEEYYYHVMKKVKGFALGTEREVFVAAPHSEDSGRAFVKELNDQCRQGIIEGLTRFAWWKDGVQFVGTCGTTLELALLEVQREYP